MAKKVNGLRNYEMMIVMKPLLPDDVRKAIHKDLSNSIKEFGGDLVDVDVWGKRYLAYDIAGHNEGYYIVYNFKLAPAHISDMKRMLGQKQEVLRQMIIEVRHPELIGKGIKKKEIEAEV
jgi:small subunit ribosomal protein S6